MAEYVIAAEHAREALWELTAKPMLYWSPLPAALFVSAWLTPSPFISGLAVGVGAAWCFVWISWLIRGRRHYAAVASVFVAPIRLTFSGEGIVVEHEHGSSRLLVSAIRHVRYLTHTLVVHTVTAHHPVLLPKKYLSDEEQRTIRGWHVQHSR